MTLPVSEFESLAERAALSQRYEQRLEDEHARVRQILEEFAVPWPPQKDALQAISDYIGTLQAALKLRETFTH